MRSFRTSIAVCLLALTVILHAVPVGAQGTALVPSSDIAYRDLDRLAELGLLDSAVMGQRPYSRRELGRLVGIATELARTSTRAGAAEARPLLRRLAQRFPLLAGDAAHTLLVAPFDGGSVGVLASSAGRRALVGIGSRIEADIGPFGELRLGTPPLAGITTTLEVAQRAEPSSWLAFSARERLDVRHARDASPGATTGELLLGNARARWHNVALTIGRTQLTWGQRPGDGLVLGSEAPALDGVVLASERPFRLPGRLGGAGTISGSLVFADLGPSVVYSHSRLLAYKVSVKPTRDLEIGGSFENHFGGAGARPTSIGNRLIDFLPFLDLFRTHNYYDTTRTLEAESDKVLALDGRVLLRRFGGITVTGELLLDDFDIHRLHTLITWDGAQSVAVIVPRIATERFSLELGAKHTGVRTYSHGQLTSGMSTRGRLLGDPLGPDAKAFGAVFAWHGDDARLNLEGRTALYSKADYRATESGTYFAITRLGRATNEQHDRLLGSIVLQHDDLLWVVGRLGGVRIRNYEFGPRQRVDYVAELAVQLLR